MKDFSKYSPQTVSKSESASGKRAALCLAFDPCRTCLPKAPGKRARVCLHAAAEGCIRCKWQLCPYYLFDFFSLYVLQLIRFYLQSLILLQENLFFIITRTKSTLALRAVLQPGATVKPSTSAWLLKAVIPPAEAGREFPWKHPDVTQSLTFLFPHRIKGSLILNAVKPGKAVGFSQRKRKAIE